MRFAVRHKTHYTYDTPGAFAVQRLRLTPAGNRAQTIHSWSIQAPDIEHAAEYIDGFGNRVHLITHCRPYSELTITAEGEVETSDEGGVLGDLGETANPLLFLRSTPLTLSSPAIDALTERLSAETRPLNALHHLLEAIASRVAYVTETTTAFTTAAEAFAAGQGVCQDHAHIFIAATRKLGIPGRYVTGYLHVEEQENATAHHAWAEVHVRNLGWVGFDPANNICPTDRYVRLACGFDAASAAPISGTRRGGGAESLTVDVMVQQQQQ